MDFQLTHFFRTVCEDALLIIDVVRINPSFKPIKESWLDCFTEGLGAVIQSESMELVPSLNNPEMSPKDETVASSINNKILTGILFEFCYSILLQFSLEELSQYPFWAAKVSLCTGPNSDPLIPAAIKIMTDRYRSGGISELFQGSAPFIVGAYLHNIASVELSMRRFFAIVISGIPRSASMLPALPTQQQTASSKLKRDFQFESLEDPTRRQETFNNTGLNASTSDSQMFLGTFKNVRSSINTNNEEREREKEKDAWRRGRNGRSPAADSSSRSGNGNGKSSRKSRSKSDHDSVEDLVSPQDSPTEGTGGDGNHLNSIWHDTGKDQEPDSEEVAAYFPGKSCSNSSSNTINIGLNIDLDVTLDIDPHVNEVAVCIDKKQGELEDNIDNDDDGMYDGITLTGEGTSPRPGNSSPPGHSPAPAPALSRDVKHSSSGSMSDATPLPTSSRLLSSNPSFPSRALPSRFTTSASSPSFPSSSSRFPSSADKKGKARPTCYFTAPGIFQRIFITALAHPFLVVSVKMITNPELNGQNWMYSYVHIVSRSGFGGLYSGIRAAVGAAFIPFPHSFLFGMTETVVYRCMLDQGIVGEGSAGPGVGLLSAVTSAVVVHKVSSEEGIYGMVRYGLLTAAQVAPGFCAFLLVRSALWLVLGDTKARRRQFSRRKEILEEYWRCCRGSSHSERVRSSSNMAPSAFKQQLPVPSPQSAASFFSSGPAVKASAAPTFISSRPVTSAAAAAMTEDAVRSN